MVDNHAASPAYRRRRILVSVGIKERPTAYLPISKEFPGKVDTTTPYVMGKIVSRLEMDSRWALARSVRALVAERDALKQKLDWMEAQFGKRLRRAS
jgi:hypothetical protein